MRRITVPTASLAVGLMLAASLATTASAATAAPKTVKACIDGKGNLKLPSSKGKCPKKTTAATLSVTGLQGVTGSAGAAGVPGPPGPQGAVGAPGSTGSTGPIGVTGQTGLAGPAGVTGTTGVTGTSGTTGATGAKGAPGVPDTSNFYDQSTSDARFVPRNPNGGSVTLTGLSFHPILSATTFSVSNFTGVYATAGYNYFAADLGGILPANTTITGVTYYAIHNVAGTAYYYLSYATPATGNEASYAVATGTGTDPSLDSFPVSLPALPSNSTQVPILYWLPAGNGTGEVLFGAKVTYTYN